MNILKLALAFLVFFYSQTSFAYSTTTPEVPTGIAVGPGME